MKRRVGYVFAGYLRPERLAATATGSMPKTEYMLFSERNNTTFITQKEADNDNYPITRLIRARGSNNWAIAAAALRRWREFDVFIATGEDVGLRLAILSKIA